VLVVRVDEGAVDVEYRRGAAHASALSSRSA
jgi:hypothetical protein